MCDTFALKRAGAVWFAKNSDREPAEVQRVELIPAVRGDRRARVKCTYIDVDQVPDRRAAVISRPQWMWGAEMGVNDAGVAVGNEAVFSRSVLRGGEALLGMDLVRLALERAATAPEAARTIADLLEKYGQGGPAGYRDKRFRYDNSFLIADPDTIIVLETAGRDWAMKRVDDAWSISNTYTIRADHDRASKGAAGDFKARHEAFAMPRLACAADRRATSMAAAAAAPGAMTLAALAGMLRRHSAGDGFTGGSNRDICMHACGLLRPHASTGSMIVKLQLGAPPRAAFTGSIQPCISLFKPVDFLAPSAAISAKGLYESGLDAQIKAKRDPSFRDMIRESISRVEPQALGALEAGDIAQADALALEWISNVLQPAGASAPPSERSGAFH
ncbi:MAG: C69 family dipeptidase [Parvularculaceae bacterium]|nr:C69 family dipeptidase [Parvularculaceae bacterium]